jgi:putative ABC transport system permease protein
VTAVLGGSLVVSLVAMAATVILVGLVYSAMLAERRRELGLLLAIGIRPRELLALVVVECAATTGFGGVCGSLLGSSALLLWQRSVGFALESSRVPLSLPERSVLVAAAVVCCALTALLGIAGAALPAWRASRSEPYSLMRGDGA